MVGCQSLSAAAEEPGGPTHSAHVHASHRLQEGQHVPTEDVLVEFGTEHRRVHVRQLVDREVRGQASTGIGSVCVHLSKARDRLGDDRVLYIWQAQLTVWEGEGDLRSASDRDEGEVVSPIEHRFHCSPRLGRDVGD